MIRHSGIFSRIIKCSSEMKSQIHRECNAPSLDSVYPRDFVAAALAGLVWPLADIG